MNPPANLQSARTQAWLAMAPEQRKDAVRCMLWGYDNEKLNEVELVDLLTCQHGHPLAQRFIETLSSGMQPRGGGPISSVAALCIRFDRMDVLEQLATPSRSIVAGATVLSTSAWIDRLCTRTTNTGQVITWTLFQTALEQSPERARSVFEFALKHQSAHPQVAETIASGKANAAILIELVMSKRIAEQSAGDSAPVQVTPAGPQRTWPARRLRAV